MDIGDLVRPGRRLVLLDDGHHDATQPLMCFLGPDASLFNPGMMVLVFMVLGDGCVLRLVEDVPFEVISSVVLAEG